MAFTDYTFYREAYKGDRIEENRYEQLSERANEYLVGLTLKTLDDQDVNIKKCECAIAEVLLEYNERSNVKSKSVGSISVAYNDKTLNESTGEVARKYLFAGGYLYRGLR